MQLTDLDTKLTGKRRTLQKSMEWACRGAIAFTAVLMLVFFATLGYRGIGAFSQTQIDIEITQIQADSEAMINESLYRLLNEPDRRAKKSLRGLVTPNAYSVVNILAPGTYTVVAHTDVDMYVKGVYDKLDDTQRSVVDRLVSEGKIYRTWNWDFWTGTDSRSPEIAGIWGAVVGTFYTIGIAILLAFPIGVGAATYMEELPDKKTGRLRDFMEININNLAAVPSIVYGLLGLAVFINFLEMPRSASLVGGLTLAILTLPTIIIASRTALRTVPQNIRDASNGLGASRLQTTVYQVLPAALPGIITGTIIGIARAIGESAPLLMIGMVAFILSAPATPMDPATTLPVQIFLWADSPERGFAEKTSAAILVLLLALVVLNVLAIWLRKRFEIKW